MDERNFNLKYNPGFRNQTFGQPIHTFQSLPSSVLFELNVHAMIFSDDALALE